MPPTCRVSVEEAVALIEQFKDHFSNGILPAWKDSVWKDMSTVLNNRWSFACVYTNVVRDRRNVLTLAMNRIGVKLATCDRNNNSSLLEDSESESAHNSDNESVWNPCSVQNEQKKKKGEETFDLPLTEDQWNSIKPKDLDSQKSTHTLQAKVWTNTIAMEFWRLYRFPCAFVFSNGYVCCSADKLSYALKINGQCKSAKCGNMFRGRAIKRSEDNGLVIEVDTRDTRTEPHDFLKRPFNGKLRKDALGKLQAVGSAGYRKHVARENMLTGDIEPPFMPSSDVARRAKKEGIDAELGIEKEDGRDIIKTVVNLTFDPKFQGVIHDVGALPFHVFYSTQPQLTTYKEYCRLNKGSATICIDSTGSLVRRLKRDNGNTSGHIFLYAIVVNFDNTTIAVEQMLSEKHDTEFITYWLKRWLRKGAPIPKEAVCDYSRALLSAISLAFNNITIKVYINFCFNSIFRRNAIVGRPPTLIRVDVAHLIHLVCRWKCFGAANQTCIKDFFVRCVALMVESQTLETFQKIFSLTCVVALQSHEDTEVDPSLAKTTKHARVRLENYIASQGIKTNFIESRNKSIGSGSEEAIVSPFDIPLGPDDSESEVSVSEWIDKQVQNAKQVRRLGNDINPFYLPAFILPLSKLSKEFPLWTSVNVPHKKIRHATSSFVEGYFNDIKTRVLKTTPLRIDYFMKIHANDITGANFVFSSKMIKYNMERLNESPKRITPLTYTIDDVPSFSTDMGLNINRHLGLDDSDLKSAENWRGKGGLPDAENANYLVDDDELSYTPIFNDPLISTQTTTEHMDFSFDESMVDHSYCIRNESTADLERSTNETPPREHDVFETSMADHSYCIRDELTADLERSTNETPPREHDVFETLSRKEDALNNNSATKNRITSAADYTEDNQEYPRPLVAAAKQCSETVSPTMDVRLNGNDDNYSSFDDGKISNLDDSVIESYGVATTTYLQSGSHDRQPRLHEPTTLRNNATAARLPVPSCKKTSKYFTAYPEIRHKNTLVKKTRKPSLLPNGSNCRSIKIKGHQYFVQNSCAFDALAHMIMTAAIDNVHYYEFIAESTNSTLKLVRDLINSGVTQRLLTDRAIILKQFCKSTCEVKTDVRVVSSSIDAWCCIEDMVNETLLSEPSVRNIEDCPDSGRKTYSQVLLQINSKPIRRSGFWVLEKALDFVSPVHNIRCQEPCKGSYTWFRELNIHIIIMLDIRSTNTAQFGMLCPLKDLPTSLTFRSTTETRTEYRLAGLVAYKSMHYIAYCRRVNGSWQEYNDLNANIKSCGEDTVIEPHLALYIQSKN